MAILLVQSVFFAPFELQPTRSACVSLSSTQHAGLSHPLQVCRRPLILGSVPVAIGLWQTGVAIQLRWTVACVVLFVAALFCLQVFAERSRWVIDASAFCLETEQLLFDVLHFFGHGL